MIPALPDDPTRETDRLQQRLRRLAEEKSNLQLILSLIQRLNPLPGIDDMVRSMLHGIVDTIGGTNIKVYYWIEDQLHYIDFLGENRMVPAIDDPLAREAAERKEFVEQSCEPSAALLQGHFLPESRNWSFPLLVGEQLVGTVKLENLHIVSASLRNYLPTFFNHVALILSNEIRNHLRLQAKAELRDKTDELDSYFNSALDLFCIADTAGLFRKLNPSWQVTLGYELAEMEEKCFLDFVHPDDLAATREALDMLSRQNAGVNFTNRCRHKNGSWRWVEWRSQPHGELIYIAARDITERKKAEEDIRKANAELEKKTLAVTRTNEDLKRFAEVTAHHLREPARCIAIYADRLDQQLSERLEDPESRLSLEFISKQARRQQSLLHDVERYLASDQPRGRQDPVDPRLTLNKVLALMSERIDQTGATVSVGNLPMVTIDLPRLADLFSIALDNALCYGRSNHPLRIRIAAELQGSKVCFSVTDNGPGIEAQYRERVFRIFERLSTGAEVAGTGIGLAVLRRIAESSEGRAWIEEAPGGGCRVLFELPYGGQS